MSRDAADAIPIPDSDLSDECAEDKDLQSTRHDEPVVWAPGTQVFATADIEYAEFNGEEPQIVILRRGHPGRVVGLNSDCNLLVAWENLQDPKPARYDQLRSKEEGADAWGSHSVCGLWSNAHGHLWICPDPSSSGQCFYEEAPQDGGFLHGILRPTQCLGPETWWLGDVLAETEGLETPSDTDPHMAIPDTEEGLYFASLRRFLVVPELSPEEDRWKRCSNKLDSLSPPVGQIRLRLLHANELQVQICGNGHDWSPIRQFDRQIPKPGSPLQLLRQDVGTDGNLPTLGQRNWNVTDRWVTLQFLDFGSWRIFGIPVSKSNSVHGGVAVRISCCYPATWVGAVRAKL